MRYLVEQDCLNFDLFLWRKKDEKDDDGKL